MKYFLTIISLVTLVSCSKNEHSDHVIFGEHNLVQSDLAKSWDEGVPLGNGMLGALVWKKDGKLRFSLDRADLWDLRPMDIKCSSW